MPIENMPLRIEKIQHVFHLFVIDIYADSYNQVKKHMETFSDF